MASNEIPSLLPDRSRAELIAALKRALAEIHEDDRAEALGPHPMVGRFDCELCGEGVCHYLHITDEEARRRAPYAPRVKSRTPIVVTW